MSSSSSNTAWTIEGNYSNIFSLSSTTSLLSSVSSDPPDWSEVRMSELGGPSDTVVTTAPSPSSSVSTSVGQQASTISLTSLPTSASALTDNNSWRGIVYENPMTVAINAMHNIHGVSDDPTSQYITFYDNYTTTKVKQDPLSVTSDNTQATEIWS